MTPGAPVGGPVGLVGGPVGPVGGPVGLVGLGIMGSAMWRHLLDRGHPVVGCDVDPARVRDLEAAGGAVAATPRKVAERADVVVTSLPTEAAAREVCAGLAGAGRAGLVVAETSTLPHEAKEDCRRLLVDAGGELLDCPLSGTGAQALVRDVVVLGSGDEAAFERARPALEAFARSVRHLGPFGAGSTMKLVANLLVAVHNAATAEAFALGQAAGLDPRQIYDTIRDGAGNSVIFEKRGALMVDRRWEPPTAKVSMFVKDAALIAEFADRVGVLTPVLQATRPLYDRAVELGLASADAAALLEVLEAPAAAREEPA
ncbi:NAD(P)-dependent oxidoreductase [Geodermatophilus sp. YIM 151500]|uniref:NAD(P)-dependent oxidoreductase n=1 Tax=Geodermatophilus sp. YIM 151500 TaxID=2984531 RepID=UPI0021E41E0C|nr:NAD(P)-dependent oxidoreductase [Geodermatophilus sp. YIM 151500]MCV2488887.1 NAD(P)-dependent oxidoreductase [Geodermatophilus sp. YIM 151500]